MKLRRAMAVAAAAAVITPLTLLSAPAAFAEAPVPSPSQSRTDGGTPETGGPGETTDGAPDATGTPDATVTPDATGTPGGAGTPDDARTPGGAGQPGGAGAAEVPAPSSGGLQPAGDSPVCETWKSDKGVTTYVTGLPTRYVAGSGWDEFQLAVTNRTGKELEKLWLEMYIWLGSAEIQFRHDGAWTDRSQYPGETSSFSAYAQDVAPGEKIVADLRVRVRAGVMSDESFAQAGASYRNGDGTCSGDGDMHEFVVVPPTTAPPEPAPSATGKPAPDHRDREDDRTKPQGGAGRVTGSPAATGSLADTGADAALPAVGAAGAAAVLLGAGAVLAARRRKAAAHG
ncbi:LPXTG cell wall anchor domain-containing protein [Streptomyces chilikensis]|uniref:LPXTG cell wall anchor domain-containing protein n=1 Tax=Streptomyces chilikensis TaxID=1194079 RepID=A0ABV3EIE2_9ACTN